MQKVKNLIVVCVFFLWYVGLCSADLAGYEIKNYQADFSLTAEGILNATETIAVNFTEPRHGIYRDIPYKYPKSDHILTTPIENVQVQGYDFSDFGNGNDYRIKIWSPDFKVNGNQTYVISYAIRGSVREFSDYQELYRNMLGTNWNTKIENFNFSVQLPSDLELEPETEFYAVWWERGSKDRVKLEKKGNTIQNAEPLSLAPHEAITIAIKFPENYMPVEEFKEQIPAVVQNIDYRETPVREKKKSILLSIMCEVIIPSLSFFFFFLVPFTSFRFIKGIKRMYAFITKKSIKTKDIIYYTPPKWFSVAEIATIYLKKEDYDAVFPTIYDRYWKKLVSLENNKTRQKILLKRINKPSDLPNRELVLWRGLGLNKKEKLSFKNFARQREVFKAYSKTVFNAIKYRIYTKQSLKSYKKPWISTEEAPNFFMLLFCSFAVLIAFYFGIFLFDDPFFTMNIVLLFYVVVFFGLYVFILTFGGEDKVVLEHTEEGKEIYQQVLGFRKYLNTVEKEKLKTLLKEDPEYFDKMLPYAIAFGMGTKWIDKCKSIMKTLSVDNTVSLDFNDRFFLLDRSFREMRHLRKDWEDRERASLSSSSSRGFDSDFGSDSGFDSDGGSSGGGGWWGGGGSR